MHAVRRLPVLLAFAAGCGNGFCQSFMYVEPANTACPAAPVPTAEAPKTVPGGTPLPGSIHVGCGFDKGSYTVTLSSTDERARFLPRTFLVNFGSIVGDNSFTVTFATLGVHAVSAVITANMGSPALAGRFFSAANTFNVVAR